MLLMLLLKEWELLLIQWQGRPLEDSTWETLEELRLEFPQLHLEDKVNLEGLGSDARQQQAWLKSLCWSRIWCAGRVRQLMKLVCYLSLCMRL